jgi:hypothetical protein
MQQRAKVGFEAKLDMRFEGQDGYVCVFAADDSLRSWWAIFRWNLHYGYWRTILRHNLRDLPKYLWRSLRP